MKTFALLAALMVSAGAVEAQSTAPATAKDTLVLDLAKVARLAAEHSRSAEVQRLSAVEAEAKVREDRAALLPNLTFDALNGQHTFNTASFGIDFPGLFDPNGQVIGPVTTIDFRGALGQTLFDWAAVKRMQSAKASYEADRIGTDAVRARAAFTAAGAYVQAIRATGRLTAREADLTVAQDLLGVAEQQLSAGVGVRLDVTRAQAQEAALRADLVSIRGAADRARLALLRSLGLPLDTPIRLAASATDTTLAQANAEAAVAAAMKRRIDIQALDQKIVSAQLDVTAVKAERLPRVSFAGDQGVNGKNYSNLLRTYAWSFRVSVPVFEGMRLSAREQEEQAQADALEAQRADLTEEIGFEVRDALLQVASARELLDASRARMTFAQAELEQARDRFGAGVAGSADVFNASLRLSDARTADVDAQAAYQAARVALATAEGAVEELK